MAHTNKCAYSGTFSVRKIDCQTTENSDRENLSNSADFFKLKLCFIVYYLSSRIFSSVVDFSSEKYIVLLDTVTPGSSRGETVRMLMVRQLR